MTEQAYWILWGAYLFSVLGFLTFSWRTVGKLLGPIKVLFFLPLLALLVTPITVEEGHAMSAPAFIVAIFEQLQGIGEGWSRGGVVLIISVAGAFLLALLWTIFVMIRRRKKNKTAVTKTQE